MPDRPHLRRKTDELHGNAQGRWTSDAAPSRIRQAWSAQCRSLGRLREHSACFLTVLTGGGVQDRRTSERGPALHDALDLAKLIRECGLILQTARRVDETRRRRLAKMPRAQSRRQRMPGRHLLDRFAQRQRHALTPWRAGQRRRRGRYRQRPGGRTCLPRRGCAQTPTVVVLPVPFTNHEDDGWLGRSVRRAGQIRNYMSGPDEGEEFLAQRSHGCEPRPVVDSTAARRLSLHEESVAQAEVRDRQDSSISSQSAALAG